ncbi:hypothetical protein HZB02_03840 [Candidatus Woesearchaeota archaeon]|nr:hypothetical protein [Candidatus Woesearchaeota archaeon]
MHIALISTTQDPASVSIRTALTAEGTLPHGVVIHEFHDSLLSMNDLDIKIKADLFVFLSKHQSASGIPSLTVHAPGNFGTAELGGKNQELCIAPAIFIKTFFQQLQQYANQGYGCIQEATHHGPFLTKTPCVFIEIGSTEKEWNDPKPAKMMAECFMKTITQLPLASKFRSALGIGGPHHCPSFKKIQFEEPIAIGHVCPKYMLPVLSETMICQALERTQPKADLILVDWKGLGEPKEKIKGMLEKIGVEWRKV